MREKRAEVRRISNPFPFSGESGELPIRSAARSQPPGRQSPNPLLVEPDVFHAPAVEDAVDHDRPALDMRLPAGRPAVVKNDRPGAVVGQFPLDLPYQLLALLGVGFD